MANPLAAAMGKAKTQMPQAEPHAKSLVSPTHKQKVAHKGRPAVEMPAKHGARASAIGKDKHASSNRAPKLPGLREPNGLQPGAGRGGMMIPPTGVKRFGDQGAPGRTVLQPKASKSHMGPRPVR